MVSPMSPFKLIAQLWRRGLIAVLAIVLCTGCARAFLPSLEVSPWQIVTLPTEANLLDISFNSADHGWLVGSRTTVLETTDGGKSWQERPIEVGDEQSYRLTAVDFLGSEGWIVGQPSILLHTTDNGQTWERIPLSSKLPGAPDRIQAVGENTAEMTTDVGAIYRTQDAGQHWKALVKDAVGVVRNIARSSDGRYVAVSAKGNFFSTWQPGDDAWSGHNRNSSRRVQSMGFKPDGGLWMLARGGQIQFTAVNDDPENWAEAITPEFATSWGLLDLAYRTPEEIWVAGGGGNLLCSFDGGRTWQKDRSVANIPSNFYKIVFRNPEQGYILGQRGFLLRYQA